MNGMLLLIICPNLKTAAALDIKIFVRETSADNGLEVVIFSKVSLAKVSLMKIQNYLRFKTF